MMFGEPPKIDYAKRVAAALGYIGLSNLDRVGITTFAAGIQDFHARPVAAATIFWGFSITARV